MNEKEQLMNDLDVAHKALQHLNIEPTKNNMTNMLFILQTLERAYTFVNNVSEKPNEKEDENA